MRVNVYNEELTFEAEIVWTEPRPGVRFCGLRLYLKSAPELHHKPHDDDRSAVTLWCDTLERAGELVLALQGAVRKGFRNG